MKKIQFLVIPFLLFHCNDKSTSSMEIDQSQAESRYMLELLPYKQTNIDFMNRVIETYEENYLNYEFLYNGSGVAVGDLDGDGLPDIYFAGNSVNDKLYLNEGNFKFKDISSTLGEDHLVGWSTGINMVDINADGLLDIYVCRSGPSKDPQYRANKLFINKGYLQFEESASLYGLDKTTNSIQSAFFDYDLDGDLDMYLMNHPSADFKVKDFYTHINEVNTGKIQSDFFFENDNGKFIDKTKEAGLVNFGFRHGIAIGDTNQDGYPDLYISSDFDEPDLLYINNRDKTYTNTIGNELGHISYNSMGNEFADINNDGLLDIYVVDMAPNNHYRSKVYMASMNTRKFNEMSKNGFHNQYMQNTLHLNTGNNTYSEVAQVSGVAKTDWSWAPLFFDADLDGMKDLFVSNGIKENFLFRDIQAQVNAKQKELGRNLKIEEVLDLVPSDITPNNMYKNLGDMAFEEVSESWVSNQNFNSNGAAYADLDNDGDLDLVMNNMESLAGIYRNNVNELTENGYLKIKLIGPEKNRFALGSKVWVETEDGVQFQELQTTRGYLSSMEPILVFGLKDVENVKAVKVVWPDGKVSLSKDVKPNQNLVLDYSEASTFEEDRIEGEKFFIEVEGSDFNLTYRHKENDFNDFSKQLLLPNKESTQGPCMAVADINNDGLDDLFLGGALNQAGSLYIQKPNGTFQPTNQALLQKEKKYEDVGALFFDADGDSDLDLYVASSGYELEENSNLLQDRLYLNDGKGNFSISADLPEMLTSSKAVKSLDYDGDGDLDLIVGGRVVPGKYPLIPPSYILRNDNGKFSDVTDTIAPDFRSVGMINDIEISDYNHDGKMDIMAVGPWMPITLFSWEDGMFKKTNITDFDKTEGWQYAIVSADFDNDGDTDYVIGNFGNNNKFHPSKKNPLHIFSNYFDDNDSYDTALSKDYNGQLVPVRGKECSSEQTPFLNEKIKSYQEFASLNIEGIYGSDKISNSNHKIAYNFESAYVENLGNGKFKLTNLPNMAQLSPTMDFAVTDINKDGFLDIIGVGNLYDAEVETVRYDASQGYVLLGDGKGNFQPLLNSGFKSNSDMRAISKIRISGNNYFIVASNNDKLRLFKV